jgi:hypothetical protein
VFEWFYFDPIVGKVISPLLFSLAGDKLNGREVREGLVQMGYTAAQLFPKTTLYNDLSQAGVTSYVFNHRDYARSTFSLYTNRGAELKPFMAWSEALANLSLLLEQPSAPRYYFLYYSAADALMHQYGPNSNQAEAEMLAWLDQMQRFITRLRSPRTLILVSADHGQTNTDPATSLAINHALPGLEAVLQRDPSSRPILFGGSPRDLFLYVQEPALLETAARIQAVLGARGEVKTSADLIAAGFFGPEPIPARLKARLGNLVILPYQGEAVYWHEKGRFEQNFYGHHGGLTAEEMLIPLMAFPT